MKIIKNTNLDSLFDSLRFAKVKVSKVEDKYSASIYFYSRDISLEDSQILIDYMRFKFDDNYLTYNVSNANNEIINFESEISANSTAVQIKMNLSRQLSFSIFRKSGIKILPKVKSSDNIPIKFIEIK
jgi:hypothetical protein